MEQYAYDPNGNRTRALSSGLDVAVGTNMGCSTVGGVDGVGDPADQNAANELDQLCRYGDYAYTYNARGQLQSRDRVAGVGSGSTTEYRYDGLGRLRKAVTDSGLTLHYVHDGRGRRIGKVVDGALERGWLYKDALNPVAELSATGAVHATFVYATRPHVPDYMVMGPGAGVDAGKVYRFVFDHLGSVRLVVNVSDGTVAQRIDYDSYGRVLLDTAPGFQPFGFAGGLYDTDLGLVRFGVRDYEPYAGRWTARDPILFRGGDSNLYAYVAGDPVNRVDPGGLYAGIRPGKGPDWHHNRNDFQDGKCPPKNPVRDTCDPDWFQYSDNQPTHGYNVDVRGRGGRTRGVQCVYDRNKNLVTDPEFEGTFDFYPPQEDLWNHFLQDFLPWVVYGN